MRGIVAAPGWRDSFERAAAMETLRVRWGDGVKVHCSAVRGGYVVHAAHLFLAFGATSDEAILEALEIPAPPREVEP